MPYIGTSPSNGVRRVHTYTATASQTTFSGASSEGVTLSYVDTNYIDVFQNGVLLGSADYTSTSGTSVVLAQGASADDLIVIVVYDVFSVADTVSKTNGGSFDSGVTMSSTLGVTGATTLTGALTGTTATFTTADNNAQLTLVSTDEDVNAGPVLDLYRNSASPADGDLLGRIKFTGESSGTGIHTYGLIDMEVNGVNDGNEQAKMIFKVSLPDGDLQNVLHVDRTEVCVNEDSEDIDFRVEGANDSHLLVCDAGQDDIYIHRNNSTINSTNFGTVFNSGNGNSSFKTSANMGAGDVAVQIYGTAGKCFIYGNGNVNNDNGSFGNFSDQTLKENIVDAQSQWADIKALQIRNFNLIANPDLTQIGVVAQELETAGMNGLVYDAQVDDDGNTKKAVKTSVLYMKAVKALQEAMTRIETLEAKVTALENAE